MIALIALTLVIQSQPRPLTAVMFDYVWCGQSYARETEPSGATAEAIAEGSLIHCAPQRQMLVEAIEADSLANGMSAEETAGLVAEFMPTADAQIRQNAIDRVNRRRGATTP